MINQTFDALNSRNLGSPNLYNRALTEENEAPFRALRLALNTFKTIQKVDSKTGELKRPPCFDSMLITVNAVQLIYENQKDRGYKFLLTSRLNQDVLEYQFSIYQQRGGYSKNPTVRTFQAAFKSNLIMNLMRPVKTSNCEPEYSTTLSNISDFNQMDIDDLNSSGSELQDDDSEITSSVLSESSADYKFTLEESSIMYFAGYLIKKFLDKFNCSECKKK